MQTLNKLIYCCSTDCKISRFTVAKKKRERERAFTSTLIRSRMCPRLPTKAAFKIFAAEPSNLQRLQNNVLDVQWKLLSPQSRCKTRQLKNFLHWEVLTLIVSHPRDPWTCFMINILVNSVNLAFQGAKSVLCVDSVNQPKQFNGRACIFKRFNSCNRQISETKQNFSCFNCICIFCAGYQR